jgi:hypothetical protein
MRLSRGFYNSLWAYRRFGRSPDSFCGKAKGDFLCGFSSHGMEYDVAFAEMENGVEIHNITCKTPSLLQEALWGKACLNLQIKLWVQGVLFNGLIVLDELKKIYSWLPSWVWRSVEGQFFLRMKK